MPQRAVAFVAGVAAAMLAGLVAGPDPFYPAWWPLGGVATAAALAGGRHRAGAGALAVVCGAFTALVLTGVPVTWAAVVALASLASAGLCAIAWRRLAGWSPTASRLAATLRLIAVLVVVGATTEAVLRQAGLALIAHVVAAGGAPLAAAAPAAGAAATAAGAAAAAVPPLPPPPGDAGMWFSWWPEIAGPASTRLRNPLLDVPWALTQLPGEWVPVDAATRPFATAADPAAASLRLARLASALQDFAACAAGVLTLCPVAGFVRRIATAGDAGRAPGSAGDPTESAMPGSASGRSLRAIASATSGTLLVLLGYVLIAIGCALAARQLLPPPWGDAVLVSVLLVPMSAFAALRLSAPLAAATLAVGVPGILLAEGWSIGADAGYDPRFATACIAACAACLSALLAAALADRSALLRRLDGQRLQDNVTGLLNEQAGSAALSDLLAAAPRAPLCVVLVEQTGVDWAVGHAGGLDIGRLEQRIADRLRALPDALHVSRESRGVYRLIGCARSLADARRFARHAYEAAELDRPAARVAMPATDAATQAGTDAADGVGPSPYDDAPADLPFRAAAAARGLLDAGRPLAARLTPAVAARFIAPEVPAGVEDCAILLARTLDMARGSREPRVFVESLDASDIDTLRSERRETLTIDEAARDRPPELFAQPIEPLHEASTEQITFELLSRLRGDDGSLIAPERFRAPLLQTRLGAAMDRAVLQQLFDWFGHHPAHAATLGRCSINLCGASLLDSTLAAHLAAQCRRAGIEPARLALEFSEADVIVQPMAAGRLFGELAAHGFAIIIDDCGASLDGFALLRTLPVHGIKLDDRLLTGLDAAEGSALLRALVDLAHGRGWSVTAKHVSDATRRDALRASRLDALQGYAIGVPVPLARLFDQPQPRLWA